MRKVSVYLKGITKLIVCVALLSLPVHAADINTDLVIVGAGGAGLTAALTASQGGLKVVLIEKLPGTGGTGNFAEGVFAVESQLQKERWVNLTKDQVFKQEMHETHWSTNSALIRRFYNESANTIDWLLSLGVKFRGPESNFYGNNPTWHLAEGLGETLLKTLRARLDADKNITLMLETTGIKLISKNGAVVGVIAENEDGKFNINSKNGVILATGGFQDNPDMVKQYIGLEPGQYRALIPMKRTGDGIRMAMEVGAVTEGMNRALLHLLLAKDADGFSIPMLGMSMLGNQPRNVWVNSLGERFCDEAVSFDFTNASGAVRRQLAVWSIFDENLRNYYITKGTEAGIGVIGEAGTKMKKDQNGPGKPHNFDFDELWNNALKNNDPFVVKGTLQDIAKKANIPYDTLKKTIDDYNTNATKNIDPDFAKDRQWLQQMDISKPLYAIKMKEYSMITLGGIRVNKYLQAVDKDHKPIPGLYMGGNDVGGMFLGSYSLSVTSGTTFGFTINSGRMAVLDILDKTRKK